MKIKKYITGLTTFFILGIFMSCNSSKTINIYFENNSKLFIDSARIDIQNYPLTFSSIKPDSIVRKQLFKDSLSQNKHDVSVHVFIYDKNKSNFTGGVFYTDLSGELSDKYTVTVNNNLEIKVVPH